MTSSATTEVAVPSEEALRLHQLMMSYLAPKALFSALELGLFDELETGPSTAEAIAGRLGLEARPARILLLALLGERLVERTGERYRNTPSSSMFLVSQSPRYIGKLAVHQDSHFAKMTELTRALRENKPVHTGPGYTGRYGGAQPWARGWVEAFRASSVLMADQLAAHADLDGRRHLVDLGCGACSYSIALAQAHPGLRITAIDQPAVAEAAGEYVAEAGLADRITVRGGNIFEERFDDCDVALLSHVIQGFDRERAERLISHVYGWLPAGGELLIHTHLPESATVPFPYLFGLILLINNTQGGEAHDQASTRLWLENAGFGHPTMTPVSPMSALLRAVKR
jgi:O-methyltransferase domain/Dimerisation domain